VKPLPFSGVDVKFWTIVISFEIKEYQGEADSVSLIIDDGGAACLKWLAKSVERLRLPG
jgi:hypothetical protein